MKWLGRIFAGLRRKSPQTTKFSELSAEDLITSAEALILKVIRDYQPTLQDRGAGYAKAEYAAFIFFWVQHWHDRQTAVRDHRTFLEILRGKVEDGAYYIRVYHSINHHKGWEPEMWFEDRTRIYRSIVEREPQVPSPSGPPSLFMACHLLATLSSRRRSLELLPSVSSSSDLLGLCLSKGFCGDALEQFNIYNQAMASLETTIPEIAEMITEMHLRRIANGR